MVTVKQILDLLTCTAFLLIDAQPFFQRIPLKLFLNRETLSCLVLLRIATVNL